MPGMEVRSGRGWRAEDQPPRWSSRAFQSLAPGGRRRRIEVPAFSWTLETCVATGGRHSRGGVAGGPRR